jgi:hypothetical protein
MLALRMRDGLPDRIRAHRSTGVCRFATLYPDGDCDWCAAVDTREAAAAPVPNPNVIVMPQRWLRTEDGVTPMRRSA